MGLLVSEASAVCEGRFRFVVENKDSHSDRSHVLLPDRHSHDEKQEKPGKKEGSSYSRFAFFVGFA